MTSPFLLSFTFQITYISPDAIRLNMQRLVAVKNGLGDSVGHAEEASSTQIRLKELRVDGQCVVEVGDAFEIAETDSSDAAVVKRVGEARRNRQSAVETLQRLRQLLSLHQDQTLDDLCVWRGGGDMDVMKWPGINNS